VSAIRTHQVLTVTIAVTDMPDVPSWDGKFEIVPHTVDIEYRWQNPELRDGWFEPGKASAKVIGARRLKSGAVGQQEVTVDFYSSYGRERPDWLAQLIADNLPEGWDK
jgi:hypothetical protein